MVSSSTSAPARSKVFPDAPAGAITPPSASKMFRTRVGEWRRANLGWVIAWIVAQVVAPAVLAVTVSVVAGIVLAVVALIALIVFCAIMWSKAQHAFWDAYAQARGLTHEREHPTLPFSVPLLSKGDKREVHRVLTGSIGGRSAHLAQYTYTDVSYTTDSEGRRQRQETDYDFTLVCFTLPDAVAQRFRGVYLHKDSLSFGRLQDKLQHDRAVELESTEFNSKYDLRVVDDQDDIALYELFSTTFVDHLAHNTFVQWEQVGPCLVIFRKNHCTDPEDLDQLCETAVTVCERYCEEHQ
jgi:hypothetical protein